VIQFGATKARVSYLQRDGRQLDAQIFLDLEAAIGRTKKTVPA
jgi:hypothetical protein